MQSQPKASFLVCIVLSNFSCVTDFPLAEGVQVQCSEQSHCRRGFECSSTLGHCVPIGQEDDPPGLVGDVELHRLDGTILVENTDLFNDGSTIVISFEVDEDLGEDPNVQLQFSDGNRAVSLVEQAGRRYTFHFQVNAAQLSSTDEGRLITVLIGIVDTVGNPASLDLPNRLTIDLTPPTLADLPPALLTPDVGNLQRIVSAAEGAKEGTAVTLSITFKETLSAAPTAVLSDGLGSVISLGAPSKDENPFFEYEYVVDAGDVPLGTDHDFWLELLATDEAGNRTDASTPLVAQTFRLDVDSPAAPQDARFVRIPWSSSSFSEPTFRLQGSGVLAPGDWLVAYADSSGAQLIAREQSLDGNVDMALSTSDRPRIWVASHDAAGNLSPVIEVADGTWIANLFGREIANDFSNPNRVSFLRGVEPALFSDLQSEPSTPDLFSFYAEDGVSMRIETSRPWLRRRIGAPGKNSGAAMQHMASTGKTFMYGGLGEDGPVGMMAEWNGEDWREIDLIGTNNPGVLVGMASTYDSLRDRIILYGGGSSFTTLAEKTWEWNGDQWLDVSPGSGPGPTIWGSMAFDAAKQAAILFGLVSPGVPGLPCPNGDIAPPNSGICALNETWEWDGAVWRQRCDGVEEVCANAPPHGRFGHDMVYDPSLDKIILFGGISFDGTTPTLYDDTWEFDYDSGWQQINPTGPLPAARHSQAMVFDPNRGIDGEVVMLQGCAMEDILDCGPPSLGEPLDDVWTFDGNQWTLQSPLAPMGSPGKRSDAAAAYDTGRAEIVLYGGSMVVDEVADCEDPITPVLCPDGRPSEGKGGGALSKCSCVFQRTWLLRSGDKWVGAQAAGEMPDGQRNVESAYNPFLSSMFIFGGSDEEERDCDEAGDEHCRRLWEWDGSSFNANLYEADDTVCDDGACDPVTDTCGPCSREDFAMTHVPTGVGQGLTLVAGGSNNLGDVPDTTWAWGGGPDWISAGVDPGARRGLAMTTYEEGGIHKALLFGGAARTLTSSCPTGAALVNVGSDEYCFFHDLWTWDGGTWQQLYADCPGGQSCPPARFGHGMVYDSVRQEVVLFGGCGYVGEFVDCPEEGAPGHPGFDPELNDTWTWSPSTGQWTKHSPVDSPTPRVDMAMAYDDARARVILNGGSRGDGTGTADNLLWEWDGTNWTSTVPLGNAPQPRRRHTMVYDPTRNRAILVGGAGKEELWELDLSPDTRAAAIFEFAWDAAGISDANDPNLRRDAITGITLAVTASASGSDINGTLVEGLVLDIWNNAEARWVAPACLSPLNPADPQHQCELGAADAQDAIFAGNGRFFLRLTPLQGMGSRPDGSLIDIDYAEISIDYTWPGPS